MKWPYVLGGILCLAALVAARFMSVEDLKGYGTVWLAIATLEIAYFTIGYGLLARWNADEIGTHLLLFSATITVSFSNLLYLRIAKGATAAPEGLMLVTSFYVILSFLFFWRAVIFTRAQLRARREMKEKC